MEVNNLYIFKSSRRRGWVIFATFLFFSLLPTPPPPPRTPLSQQVTTQESLQVELHCPSYRTTEGLKLSSEREGLSHSHRKIKAVGLIPYAVMDTQLLPNTPVQIHACTKLYVYVVT